MSGQGPRRPQRMADRFPHGLGLCFTGIPVALLEHGRALGLDSIDLAIVTAVLSFDGAPPGAEAIARRAGTGRATVQKRLTRRNADGQPVGLARYVAVRSGARGENGRQGANAYDLTALWNAVAATQCEAADRASPGGTAPADTKPPAEARTAPPPEARSPVEPCLPQRRGPCLPGRPVVENGQRGTAEKLHTDRVRGVAGIALHAFNVAAGSDFTEEGWLEMIATRVEEFPELDADAHRSIINRVFANPWWRDDPSPSVIYRDRRTFERALHAGRTAPRRRDGERATISIAEMEAMADRLAARGL